MSALPALIKRDIKLFFKDKGMFFTSLVTPAILLVLYVTFLGNVYYDSIRASLPEGFSLTEEVMNGIVGGELFSSLLAVCCVTVAFCSNMLMVQDKVSGAARDFGITPVKRSVFGLGYYVSTVAVTLIICLFATAACFVYLAFTGWFLSFTDVLLLLLDVSLLVLFGTALSSVINFFLTSQGQMSAVGTVISAGYGFICGAYMPISQFGEGLQKVISFLPGTYGTSLIRNHALRGVFEEMTAQGVPDGMLTGIRDSIDCNLYFFGSLVEIETMYLILAGSVAVLMGAYVLIHILHRENRRKA